MDKALSDIITTSRANHHNLLESLRPYYAADISETVIRLARRISITYAAALLLPHVRHQPTLDTLSGMAEHAALIGHHSDAYPKVPGERAAFSVPERPHYWYVRLMYTIATAIEREGNTWHDAACSVCTGLARALGIIAAMEDRLYNADVAEVGQLDAFLPDWGYHFPRYRVVLEDGRWQWALTCPVCGILGDFSLASFDHAFAAHGAHVLAQRKLETATVDPTD